MSLVFQNSWKWIQDNIYISNIVNTWQTKFAVAIFWFKLLYLFLSIWSCSVFNISWYHVPYFWTKHSYGAQTTLTCISQKQPSRGVLKKSCSENIQHIYSKTPMPNCDFSNVALQLYWKDTSAWVFSCKFAAYFQNNFS